jgi:hypothetical protein
MAIVAQKIASKDIFSLVLVDYIKKHGSTVVSEKCIQLLFIEKLADFNRCVLTFKTQIFEKSCKFQLIYQA